MPPRRPGPARGARHPSGSRSAPPLPEGADPGLLDRSVRGQLRSLPAALADQVAAHLVAAGQLLDEAPQRAHRHAGYARRLAPRLPAVREAHGLTAYRVGDYATALSELRALRRMTGDVSYLPVMADAERGLGRPERALALGRDPEVARLDPASRAELAIVLAGARRDLDDPRGAVTELRPLVRTRTVRPWTVRLWYAYADALLATGDAGQAREWFEAAAGIDLDGETDAAERAAALDDDPAR